MYQQKIIAFGISESLLAHASDPRIIFYNKQYEDTVLVLAGWHLFHRPVRHNFAGERKSVWIIKEGEIVFRAPLLPKQESGATRNGILFRKTNHP